jgi:serine/threonine-protein kinase
MAKVMHAAGGMGTRTRAGTLLGAPAYMSPEQVKGAADVDARTDLFSAGVILYEMLTGRVAFPAPTEYARLAAVLSTEPEPVERIDPTLAALAPIVARAMRKDRQQRFASALEMAHAIASVSLSDARPFDHSPEPAPLSQLPQIRSALATSAAAPTAPSSMLAQTAPAPQMSTPLPRRHKPGGTLESPAAPRTIADPPPLVAIAAIDGTLPSKGMPVIATGRKGVPRLVVALLVAAALGAGFLLGWACSRM